MEVVSRLVCGNVLRLTKTLRRLLHEMLLLMRLVLLRWLLLVIWGTLVGRPLCRLLWLL